MEFAVGDKVSVFENGELVPELEGSEVSEVTDDTVFVKAYNNKLPKEINELMNFVIPHSLDGIAKGEENEGYSIKKKTE